jgi:membrane-associated phospholipid phosphatase
MNESPAAKGDKSPPTSSRESPSPTDTSSAEGKPTDAQSIEQADVALGVRMASNRRHPVVRFVRTVSKLSDQEPLYLIGAGLAVVGLGSRNLRLAQTGVAVLAGVGLADAGKSAVKRLVRRTRPHVLLDEGRYAAEAGGSPAKPEQSFPSGHAACGVAAAIAVGRRYPAAGAVSGATTAVLGWSRVASGAHWPLDVVAGVAVGVAAEQVSDRLLRALGWAD